MWATASYRRTVNDYNRLRPRVYRHRVICLDQFTDEHGVFYRVRSKLDDGVCQPLFLAVDTKGRKFRSYNKAIMYCEKMGLIAKTYKGQKVRFFLLGFEAGLRGVHCE